MNHDDLGNYSHTYVNGLKAQIADLEAALAQPVPAPTIQDCLTVAAQPVPAAPIQQERDNWISVEDRLPTETGWYACLVSDPDDVGWLTSVWWRVRFDADDSSWGSSEPVEDGQPVTHWMPLPPPPAIATTSKGST